MSRPYSFVLLAIGLVLATSGSALVYRGAKQIQDSVISVVAYRHDGTESAHGSGFVASRDGVVVTAFGVTKAAARVKVRPQWSRVVRSTLGRRRSRRRILAHPRNGTRIEAGAHRELESRQGGRCGYCAQRATRVRVVRVPWAYRQLDRIDG